MRFNQFLDADLLLKKAATAGINDTTTIAITIKLK